MLGTFQDSEITTFSITYNLSVQFSKNCYEQICIQQM